MQIRELVSPADFKQAESLQRAAWDMDDIDVMPASAMIAVAHEGGLAAGAFDGDRMAGLVFGFPAADPGRQHSHMLGVLPAYRRMGLGARLKLYQREWCLARGVRRVVWTYDPLLAANAHFNIARLGCVVRTYLPDFYGPLSGINAGAPTDRLLAEWELESPRVVSHVAHIETRSPLPATGAAGVPHGGGDGGATGQPPAEQEIELAGPAGDDGCPGEPLLGLEASRVGIAIPGDFAGLLRRDPALALRWRLHARELFRHYLERAYVVTGFERRGAGGLYVLEASRSAAPRHKQP